MNGYGHLVPRAPPDRSQTPPGWGYPFHRLTAPRYGYTGQNPQPNKMIEPPKYWGNSFSDPNDYGGIDIEPNM